MTTKRPHLSLNEECFYFFYTFSSASHNRRFEWPKIFCPEIISHTILNLPQTELRQCVGWGVGLLLPALPSLACSDRWPLVFIRYEVVIEPIPNHLRVKVAKVGKWEWKNKGIGESCPTLVDEVHTLSTVNSTTIALSTSKGTQIAFSQPDMILSWNSVTQQPHWCSARTLVSVAFGWLKLDVLASLE